MNFIKKHIAKIALTTIVIIALVCTFLFSEGNEPITKENSANNDTSVITTTYNTPNTTQKDVSPTSPQKTETPLPSDEKNEKSTDSEISTQDASIKKEVKTPVLSSDKKTTPDTLEPVAPQVKSAEKSDNTNATQEKAPVNSAIAQTDSPKNEEKTVTPVENSEPHDSESPFPQSESSNNAESYSPTSIIEDSTTSQKDTLSTENTDSNKSELIPTQNDASPEENTFDELTCTLSVRCDNAIGKTTSKDMILPDDGIIFAEKTVVFYEGESVFNILVREMKKSKIHLEFVNTPIYNSAYIEGINNLYEFDCGELSGWMYKVNGYFPNYGCSSYEIKSGDKIEWVYTCDLGKDVGGEYSARNGMKNE